MRGKPRPFRAGRYNQQVLILQPSAETILVPVVVVKSSKSVMGLDRKVILCILYVIIETVF